MSRLKSFFCSEARRVVTELSISVKSPIPNKLSLIHVANKHGRVMGLSPTPEGVLYVHIYPVQIG